MSDLAYGYANARIRGMHAALLGPEKYRELTVVSSVEEMTTLLEDTPYREALVGATQRAQGIQALLSGLHAHFSLTLRKLSRTIPQKAQSLFEIAVAEWDVQDVKTAVSKKFLKEEWSDREFFLASSSVKRLLEIIRNTDDPADLLDLLRIHGYSDAVSLFRKSGAKPDDLSALLSALDESLYLRFRNTLKDHKTEANTRKLLAERLELTNTLLVLRLKNHVPSEKILEKLVVAPSRNVRKLLDAKDLSLAIGTLELPEETLALFEKTGALSSIELALEKRFMVKALFRLRFSVLSFGTVLGFLYLQSAEITQLKRLALGKYFGMGEEMKQTAYW